MDFTQALTYLERGLALVGVLAISVWLIKWLSAFLAKQRELSELDKEIRSALKEALEAERIARAAERQTYEGVLNQVTEEKNKLDAATRSQSTELTGLQKQVEIAKYANALASKLAYERTRDESERAEENLLRAAGPLISTGKLSPAGFLDVFRAAFSRAELPSEPEKQVLYHASSRLNTAVRLGESFQVATSLVPTLLEEHGKDPHAPLQELLERWKQRLRKGELYKRPGEN